MEETKKVFVTIGWEKSNIPMARKIACHIYPGESVVKIAKKIRKDFADNCENHGWAKGSNFKPSQFFYAVYDDIDAKIPFECSENTPEKFRNIPAEVA